MIATELKKNCSIEEAIAQGIRVLGKAHVEAEAADIRTRLASDPVLGKECGKAFEAIVQKELAQGLLDQAWKAKAEESADNARFLRECKERVGEGWDGDHYEEVLTSYESLTSKDSEIARSLSELGLRPKNIRWLLAETDEFAANLVRYSEDAESGCMDWRYLFEYARCLKGRLRTLEIEFPSDRMRLLKPFVSVFASAVLNYDRAFDPAIFSDPDDCFLEFVARWDIVQYALGEDPFDKAVDLARFYPITLLNERTGEDSVRFVAGIAFHLQLIRGEEVIMLPTERIGQLFGKSGDAARKSGSRVLQALRKAELIIETKSDWNHRTGEAKEFRFKLAASSYVPPDAFVTQLAQVSQLSQVSPGNPKSPQGSARAL